MNSHFSLILGSEMIKKETFLSRRYSVLKLFLSSPFVDRFHSHAFAGHWRSTCIFGVIVPFRLP